MRAIRVLIYKVQIISIITMALRPLPLHVNRYFSKISYQVGNLSRASPILQRKKKKKQKWNDNRWSCSLNMYIIIFVLYDLVTMNIVKF